MRINTNISAMDAQRNLFNTGLNMAKSVEKLSSGFRINRAADDAAGLTISEKLRGQVRGLNQAVRNAQSGIDLIQTAEGGLNESHSMLQRMRELSIQAANETLVTTDLASIASELVALQSEFDRIANTTEYNTKSLLKGSLKTVLDTATSEQLDGEILATAKNAIEAINVANAQGATTYTFSTAGAGTVTLTNGTTGVGQTVAVAAMTTTGTSLQQLNFTSLGVTVSLSGFAATATAANLITDLTTAANDAIITTAGGAASLQIGANANQTVALSIASALSTDATMGNAGGYATLSAAITAFNAAPTAAIAQNLLLSVDDALGEISKIRGSLGAVQNRLEHSISNLSVASGNLAASESRIRDTDMAAEMVNFTKNQILSQAGVSILAQANQAPQSILALLR